MPASPNGPRCAAKTRTGGECANAPCTGGKRCRMHGGATPQARRKAAERQAEDKARKAMQSYGQKIDTDPVTALLDEVCWTAGHVAWLRDRVKELERETLVWGVTERVDKGSGEFEGVDTTEAAVPNIWLSLYQKERAHLVAVCKAAISAGIEERRVRLAERQGDLIVEVLQRILGDLNLTPEQAERVPAIAAQHLRQMSVGLAA